MKNKIGKLTQGYLATRVGMIISERKLTKIKAGKFGIIPVYTSEKEHHSQQDKIEHPCRLEQFFNKQREERK
jgi:hypothetical protein